MAKHKRTWIVLADSSRALIVKRRENEPGFDVVTHLASKEAHVPGRDIVSDRPGRTQESGYSAHHAIEPRHDPHAMELTAFVRTVAQYLNQQSAANAFERVILFAPKRALGQLREMLDEPTRAKVRAEEAKDLTKLPLEELPKHLATLDVPGV